MTNKQIRERFGIAPDQTNNQQQDNQPDQHMTQRQARAIMHALEVIAMSCVFFVGQYIGEWLAYMVHRLGVL